MRLVQVSIGADVSLRWPLRRGVVLGLSFDERWRWSQFRLVVGRRVRLMAVGDERGGCDEVVAAAKAGEEWALVALYRRFHPALVRYLRAQAIGEEEDLASDVWVEVSRGLVDFDGDVDALGRFAFTIARRRAIDHGRKRGRRRTDPVSGFSMEELVDRADPEQEVVDRLAGDAAVDRIVALLPKDLAEIVVLRVVAGLSVAEVAEIVGRRPAAVSMLQHRALRRLARHLET